MRRVIGAHQHGDPTYERSDEGPATAAQQPEQQEARRQRHQLIEGAHD